MCGAPEGGAMLGTEVTPAIETETGCHRRAADLRCGSHYGVVVDSQPRAPQAHPRGPRGRRTRRHRRPR